MSRVLISGATAGIGKATAEVFAEQGWNLVLTGRRKERLAKIKSDLSSQHNVEVETLAFDIQDKAALTAALEQSAVLDDLDILVNNAGLALGKGTIQEGDSDDWDTMIDTNVKGPVSYTHLTLPTTPYV